jgi:hypothetical protein
MLRQPTCSDTWWRAEVSTWAIALAGPMALIEERQPERSAPEASIPLNLDRSSS